MADTRMLVADELLSEVRTLVPPLDPSKYKGQAGKIAVVGGSREYTGAPWFSAYASLMVGADLSHVFCTESAGPTIKGYSPELIVHPYLKDSKDFGEGKLTEEQHKATVEKVTKEVSAWFSRLDCLVVGPGLGRDPLLLDTAASIISAACAINLPLVLDADALFLIAREPELIKGYDYAVLTPNLNEYRRLAAALGVFLHGQNNDRSSKLMEVTQKLEGPTIVSKGPADAICDGEVVVSCEVVGSSRRCGGQGDVLSGAIAVFVAWAVNHFKQHPDAIVSAHPLVLGAFGGCTVTRRAAHMAFKEKRRSTVAGDVLHCVGRTVEILFDSVTEKEAATKQNALRDAGIDPKLL